jgi:hypothetical protein
MRHCCPVKRGLFCKLGLLHKGFWGVYFVGTLSAVWASGGNFLLISFLNQGVTMYADRTLFSQVMDFVPWTSFDRIVRKYGGDVRVRTLRCTEHFRVMAFTQVTYRESLRDIEACLGAQPSKLCSMGLREPIAKSTLADANELRDWRIWFDLAAVLIKRARKLYVKDDIGLDLANTVYALDSTTTEFGVHPRNPGLKAEHGAGLFLVCKWNSIFRRPLHERSTGGISDAHRAYRRLLSLLCRAGRGASPDRYQKRGQT